MVSDVETSLTEARAFQTDWQNYEFWEQIESRHRRKRRILILLTMVVSALLLSVPVVIDNKSKWDGLSLTVKLANEITVMKRDAAIYRTALKIAFTQPGSLKFEIRQVQNCRSEGDLIRRGDLLKEDTQPEHRLLKPEEGQELGIPSLVNEFCYDPLGGTSEPLDAQTTVGFGIIPVKDLAQKRISRVSILVLKGPSAEISFN